MRACGINNDVSTSSMRTSSNQFIFWGAILHLWDNILCRTMVKVMGQCRASDQIWPIPSFTGLEEIWSHVMLILGPWRNEEMLEIGHIFGAWRHSYISIVHHGNNHFCSRIISPDGTIWYNDGITTRNNSVEDGHLSTISYIWRNENLQWKNTSTCCLSLINILIWRFGLVFWLPKTWNKTGTSLPLF